MSCPDRSTAAAHETIGLLRRVRTVAVKQTPVRDGRVKISWCRGGTGRRALAGPYRGPKWNVRAHRESTSVSRCPRCRTRRRVRRRRGQHRPQASWPAPAVSSGSPASRIRQIYVPIEGLPADGRGALGGRDSGRAVRWHQH